MFDICIVGSGGLVGSAIARELALSNFSVVGIEKHTMACQETSGHNSCVIHSGFHEVPGTLKATLAREGSRLMLQYAEERGIKLLKTGMLIAVPHGSIRAGLWREMGDLWRLWKQSWLQDIPVEFAFTPRAVRRRAPVSALGGVFLPRVSVVDVKGVVASLGRDAVSRAAQFFYNHEAKEIHIDGPAHTITTTGGEIRARVIVNSAGLQAHEVSVMAGGPRYDIQFFRGDYYEIIGGVERWGIHTLVYPAMPRNSLSKGIHIGARTDGRLFIGPSAVRVADGTSRDADRAQKSLFLEAARKFLPAIRDHDLQWSYAGIRPKRIAGDGKADFTIRLERTDVPLINLIGIDSPGLSASLAIARRVREIVERLPYLPRPSEPFV
jgi:L-2-hydroxyglutarate oxidase LhgO